MKWLISILLLLPISLWGQVDSITVASEQIVRAAETIQRQRDTIQRLNHINAEYSYQIDVQSIMLQKDSIEIELLNRRADIADGIIDRYQSYLKRDEKKWYNNPWVYYAGGFASALIVTIMVNNVSN